MAAQLHLCQYSGLYLARLGSEFNQLKRYAEAADHLERALLLDPDNPNTQLDYAIALAGGGDVDSALNLLALIQGRPDLPEPLRVGLAQVRQQWSGWQGLRQSSATRWSVGWRVGHDSNLLGTPNLSSIRLTLPDGALTLPVDSSSLPKPGMFVRADARVETVLYQAGGHRWDLQAGALLRNSPNVVQANSTQAELQLEYTHLPAAGTQGSTGGAWGPYASLALTTLQAHSGTNYLSQGVSVGAQWLNQDAPRCSGRLTGDWQNRQLHSNEVLSGHYWGGSAQLGCLQPSGMQWQVIARAGEDKPTDTTRPGGAQRQYSLRGYAGWPVGSRGHWLLDAEASHNQDESGYSALLESGVRRSIERYTLRTEFHYKLAPGWLGLAGVERVRQQSNIPIFALGGRGLYIGLRYSW